MKINNFKKTEYQIKDNQISNVGNQNIKTTNINILLNRVREEKKNKSKKIIILSIGIIGVLFFLSTLVFTN